MNSDTINKVYKVVNNSRMPIDPNNMRDVIITKSSVNTIKDKIDSIIKVWSDEPPAYFRVGDKARITFLTSTSRKVYALANIIDSYGVEIKDVYATKVYEA